MQRGNVHIETISERKESRILGSALDQLLNDMHRDLGGPCSGVRSIGHLLVAQSLIACRQSHGRDAAFNSGVRRTSGAAQRPHKRTQVGTVIGTSNNKVGNFEIAMFGEHRIESDKGASGGGTIVVPDV